MGPISLRRYIQRMELRTTSGLPTTRKVARRVNTSALIGTLPRLHALGILD